MPAEDGHRQIGEVAVAAGQVAALDRHVRAQGHGQAKAHPQRHGAGQQHGQRGGARKQQVCQRITGEGGAQGTVFMQAPDHLGHQPGGRHGHQRHEGQQIPGPVLAPAQLLQAQGQDDDGGEKYRHGERRQRMDEEQGARRAGRWRRAIHAGIPGRGRCRHAAPGACQQHPRSQIQQEGIAPARRGQQTAQGEEQHAAQFDRHALPGDHAQPCLAAEQGRDQPRARCHHQRRRRAQQETVGEHGNVPMQEHARRPQQTVQEQPRQQAAVQSQALHEHGGERTGQHHAQRGQRDEPAGGVGHAEARGDGRQSRDQHASHHDGQAGNGKERARCCLRYTAAGHAPPPVLALKKPLIGTLFRMMEQL
ncbi:hypothetical protein JAB5_49920 [Janthinobacterium sp. HH103]|nr:hypothetical protein JAB5_49920 [Janthinobacterium sp. HH103]